ncbi:unannotated protein [freshwater metagenome]|uniref:Unannotated protein n=1 Tax=freshwater metagenome TaxID=449393 RepID=A0A6J7D339_9ZZZZ
MQQVRGGVVALRRVAGGTVHARHHALADGRRGAIDHQRLVITGSHDVNDPRELRAIRSAEHPDVADLPAALRVERRLGQLQQRPPILLRDALDDRVDVELLIPDELHGIGAEVTNDLLCPADLASARAGCRARPLRIHQLGELRVLRERHTALGRDLAREFDRESKGVMQPESVGRTENAVREQVVEQLRSLLERALESLLLSGGPLHDRRSLLDKLGIARTHRLDHLLGVARQEEPLDSDPRPLLNGPAHHAAQDVPAILVRGNDAVADQEGHRPGVIGEDAQRPLIDRARRKLASELHQRRELVGLEDRLDALLDQRHPIEAQAGVDRRRRQRRQHRTLRRQILIELHEDQIPELQEALVLAAGKIIGRAVLQAPVEVELAAWTTRAGRAGLPEVLRARAQDDPLARDAHGLPVRDRVLVRPQAELLVSLEDRHPDVRGIKTEPLERERPGLLDGALLEVAADREVAEHLEEGEMTRGIADVLDVGGAEALLAAGQQLRGRLFDPEEVPLERVHTRRGEQHRLVEGRRNERCGGPPEVTGVLEKLQKSLADLVRRHRHRAIVAHPRTRSPSSNTAVCPGAIPQTGSWSSSISPTSVHATGSAW